MTLDLAMSSRAQQAQRLTDSVLAHKDCLARVDELVRAVAVTLTVDFASLSVLTDRQITVSAYSPAAPRLQPSMLHRGAETPFEDTVCANVLRSNERFAIPDAHLDPRISSIPAVTAGLVGAYLGSPLRHEGGADRDALHRDCTAQGVDCARHAGPRSSRRRRPCRNNSLG